MENPTEDKAFESLLQMRSKYMTSKEITLIRRAYRRYRKERYIYRGNCCSWDRKKIKVADFYGGIPGSDHVYYYLLLNTPRNTAYGKIERSGDLVNVREEESAYLFESYFCKRFSKKYNRRVTRYYNEEFEHYAMNYFPIDIVRVILKDMEKTVYLLKNDIMNPLLGLLLKDAGHWFLDNNHIFSHLTLALDEEEHKKLYICNRELIIELYIRFIRDIRKLIADNPDKKIFVVAGP